MKLRDNFPKTKEAAARFGVEFRDVKGVLKIFEPKDPTSLSSLEKSIEEASDFLVQNGYDSIPSKNFIDNDFQYKSSDEIVSFGKHGYIEAFVLFIEREDIDVVKICKKVLVRLDKMDYEKESLESDERLIFPNKEQANGNVKRISEQELRVLFIEEFLYLYPEFYYSIETPTQKKYKFGKSYDEIVENVNVHKISASLDMCVFKNNIEDYDRILNIEFKHNSAKKGIGKDILKLLRERQNGAFILLLNNTRKGKSKGTLWNENNTGAFNKLYNSFNDFQKKWNEDDGNRKNIQLIIISLEKKTLIHRKIIKSDLQNLKEIFFIENGCGNINEIEGKVWKSITIETK